MGYLETLEYWLFLCCLRLVSRCKILCVVSRPGYSPCTSFDRVILTLLYNRYFTRILLKRFLSHLFDKISYLLERGRETNTGRNKTREGRKRKSTKRLLSVRFMKGKEKGRRIAMVSFPVRQAFRDDNFLGKRRQKR